MVYFLIQNAYCLWLKNVPLIDLQCIASGFLLRAIAGAVAGLGARLLTGSYYGQTIQIWSALIMASILAATLVFSIQAIGYLVSKKMGYTNEEA